MDNMDDLRGCESLELGRDGRCMSQEARNAREMAFNAKKAVVHAEMDRVNKLPAHSTYAMHRMRVLNKLLHLMSIQRTIAHDEELELLFASLSL